MSESKPCVAFIGSSGIARVHMRRLTKYPDCEVVAASDVSDAALQKAKQAYNVANLYIDWKAMLKQENPAAVSVCKPNGMHAEPTYHSAETGRDVPIL